MPIYEFRCRKCKAVNEFLVRGTGLEAGTTCPECGCERLEKLISAAAIASRNGAGQGTASSAPSTAKKSCTRASCAGCASRCR
ncbi:MAG TPA: zinc ribbon domain-containing protein [Planctomycetota bacterium]|nr:zinc ribbon domain-containing protein [Planctomycetota bacterium]OQC19871.1 MAG: Zinc ribbon domain protein [Planctomycetes bacterium ADurb.Bin069]NMD36421.1 zinc ribbon domain-containing protein [Planctomycetota bacterium]HNR99485.1 zinc ribbon domain-containing protein [Planctomycetota bacterium]HNU26326.1 zinc ribbon domain-containing protein [Planctomycetota bacterium]